ncbi:DUF6503 family protein [Zobellia laminariae]|uniref:DUF6503 family protein n=1 Tax=Zobellia laminariae TaxID=248906 RepID=UPI0026F45ACE|nr:DUF6503 family protein [Zobellia laminariae]WKX75931.1 hypothetical protein Q5W13_20440 [Zobellia laminariae]
MNKKLKSTLASFLLTMVVAITVNAQNTDTKSAELLDALVAVNGGYTALDAKKDIQYHYVYDNFAKGKDVSIERYIFNGEQSWGSYEQHDINLLPGQKGTAVQSLVDNKPALTLDGKSITDPKAIGGTVFLRKVNIYWFAMMYKLKNPGTNYKYLGTEKVGDINYDKVSLTYSADVTKKEKNDDFILYFNPNTHLVDQFFFSLPAMGVNKPILKMTLTYEKVDGLLLSTVRKSYMPDKKGGFVETGVYTMSDIKFNNGFKKEDFLLN